MKEISIKVRIDEAGNRIASITHSKGFRSTIELRLELLGTFFWLLNKEVTKIPIQGKTFVR